MKEPPRLRVVGGEPSQAVRRMKARARSDGALGHLRRTRRLLLALSVLFAVSMVLSVLAVLGGSTWSVLMATFWGFGAGFTLGLYIAFGQIEELTKVVHLTLELMEKMVADRSWDHTPEGS